MHHFFFLPYTRALRWKGCGDHTYVLYIPFPTQYGRCAYFFASASIHCWAVFVREGYLVSEWSIEEPGRPLSNEFTYTYLPDGRKTWERVGRGGGCHNPVEDHLRGPCLPIVPRPTYSPRPSPMPRTKPSLPRQTRTKASPPRPTTKTETSGRPSTSLPHPESVFRVLAAFRS
jgi:hypothetical protein